MSEKLIDNVSFALTLIELMQSATHFFLTIFPLKITLKIIYKWAKLLQKKKFLWETLVNLIAEK